MAVLKKQAHPRLLSRLHGGESRVRVETGCRFLACIVTTGPAHGVELQDAAESRTDCKGKRRSATVDIHWGVLLPAMAINDATRTGFQLGGEWRRGSVLAWKEGPFGDAFEGGTPKRNAVRGTTGQRREGNAGEVQVCCRGLESASSSDCVQRSQGWLLLQQLQLVGRSGMQAVPLADLPSQVRRGTPYSGARQQGL